MSNASTEVNTSPSAICDVCYNLFKALRCQLDAANSRNVYLNNEMSQLQSAYQQLYQRCNHSENTLKEIASKQTQRHNQLEDHRLRLANETMDCQIAKQNLAYESESHKKTEANLVHEQEMTSKLIAILNHRQLSWPTESAVQQNPNLAYVVKADEETQRKAEQMSEDLRASKSLIAHLQRKIEDLKADQGKAEQTLVDREAEVLVLREELTAQF